MPSTGSLTKQLALPLLAAAVSYVIGLQLNSPPDPGRETGRRSGGDSPARHESPPGGNGAGSLLAWSERVTAANESELPTLAKALLNDSRRHDSALWSPLLARWSAGDGAAMIFFLEREAPPSVREYLLELAWFAWGASDPDAALAAGEDLNASMIRQVLEGVAETDPRKAADFARRTPDAQFVVASLAAHICNADPELAQELLNNAVYDGARSPFERNRIAQLAATDPAAAIAYAESLGVLGHDPVPGAVAEIARIDPIQAAASVEAMPRNRTRALSAVELAKNWAAQDLQAAAGWARENLAGPVRHYALVAAAGGSTDPDPTRALDLIVEAGWLAEADFFNIRDNGNLCPSESTSIPGAQDTARHLLQKMARTDPRGTADYLQTKIPAYLRADFAESAGLDQ